MLSKTNLTNDYRVIFIKLMLAFLFSYFRYHCPVPKIFYVQLTVGNNEFFGEGKTRQAARHNAAMKALQALQNEPIPEKSAQVGHCGMWQPISNSCPGRWLRRQRNASLQIEEVSASRREHWIGYGGTSAHLCAQLDSCVFLGWPCLRELWLSLPRQGRIWECEQRWEITFIYFALSDVFYWAWITLCWLT